MYSNFSSTAASGSNGSLLSWPSYLPMFYTNSSIESGLFIKVIVKFNETNAGRENYDGTIGTYCDYTGNANNSTNLFKSGAVRFTEIQVPAAHHLSSALN